MLFKFSSSVVRVVFTLCAFLIAGSGLVRADTQYEQQTCDSKNCYDIYAVNTKGTKFELTESCAGTKVAYGFSCSSPSVPVTCSHSSSSQSVYTCTCNQKEQKVKYSVHASMDCQEQGDKRRVDN